jgi:hypothetical protein
MLLYHIDNDIIFLQYNFNTEDASTYFTEPKKMIYENV